MPKYYRETDAQGQPVLRLDDGDGSSGNDVVVPDGGSLATELEVGPPLVWYAIINEPFYQVDQPGSWNRHLSFRDANWTGGSSPLLSVTEDWWDYWWGGDNTPTALPLLAEPGLYMIRFEIYIAGGDPLEGVTVQLREPFGNSPLNRLITRGDGAYHQANGIINITEPNTPLIFLVQSESLPEGLTLTQFSASIYAHRIGSKPAAVEPSGARQQYAGIGVSSFPWTVDTDGVVGEPLLEVDADGELRVKEAGLYTFNVRYYFNGRTDPGPHMLWFFVGDVADLFLQQHNPPETGGFSLHGSVTVWCAAGEFVYISLYTGSTNTAQGGSGGGVQVVRH